MPDATRRLPASAFAQSLTLCVYDPMGSSGPAYKMADTYRIKAKEAMGAAGFGSEGLSTLRFRVERTTHYVRRGATLPHVFHHHIVLD